MNIQELINYHKSQCQKHISGQCTTRRCLLRGGYNDIAPVDFNLATCPYDETVKILETIKEK